MKTLIFIFVYCIVAPIFNSANATTYSTVGPGPWSGPFTWNAPGIPPLTLPAGDSIIINHALIYDVVQRVLGVMIINSSGSITSFTDNLLIGNGGTNQGKLLNFGSITVRDLRVQPDGGCLLTDPLPVAYNYGTITTTDNLRIGANCGAGAFHNDIGGKVNVSDDMHIDGTLCNADTITVVSRVWLHGGTVECCGYIETPYWEVDNNGARASVWGCQNICTSGGGDPVLDIDNGIYVDLNDAYNNAPASDVSIDDDSTCVCGLNQAGGDCSGILPLPIELVEFSARALANYMVELSWKTASELNNDFFTIERSKYGQNWSVIGSKDGAGNSSVTLHYQFIDISPYAGTSYYRLRQTDFDGKYEYSKVVSVKLETDINSFQIYPNPGTELITLEGDGLYAEIIRIYDVVGKEVSPLVKISAIDNSRLIIDISVLPAGTYFISHDESVKRLVKLD
ncbi:T9SS type A sorting domain-containing protein [Crocinitomix catalasitica]|nr:T9SS type A sorting domain-containing protein [Crocinitomix catalasitica]